MGANASGTHKLKPLVIGKSARPRCLWRINLNSLPVVYRANSKAWMRSDIFEEWLRNLNGYFRIQDKKILLLIDNAAAHFDPNSEESTSQGQSNLRPHLSHIEIAFLPPNTTAHLQPMDAGIIKSFKSKYKALYCRHILTQFEAGEDINK